MRWYLNSSAVVLALLLFGSFSLSNEGEEWMARLDDQTLLSRVNIPGTHDTCALYGMLAWGQCQTMKLDQQLNAGVRFLDIRCKLIDGDLKIYHGIVDQKTTFTEVINTCQKFLVKNPSETVLMSIMDEGSPEIKPGEFGAAIQKAMQVKPQLWVQTTEVPKLNQVRGKIVVISRNKEVSGIRWRSLKIQDAFRLEGQDAIKVKWQRFEKHATAAASSDKGWYINFASGTGVFYPPKSTAADMNVRLLRHFKKPDRGYQGIVVMDFAQPDLIEAIVNSNKDLATAAE